MLDREDNVLFSLLLEGKMRKRQPNWMHIKVMEGLLELMTIEIFSQRGCKLCKLLIKLIILND